MKITILGLDDKRKTGLETWKDNLIEPISKENDVKEIYTKNWIHIIKNLKFALQSDISHSYSQSPGTILIMFLRKCLKKKNIHTVHGDYYEEQVNKKGLKRIFWIPFNRLCNLFADEITFPTDFLRKKILEKEPSILDKSCIISNGINTTLIKKIRKYPKEKLGLKKSQFLIIQVTNFNLKQKASGIDILIRDFKTWNLKNKVLFIVGGGKLLEVYKKKYESKNVTFLGFRKDALRLIKTCDLFVHYSKLDNFPMAILEAIALRKPIIAKGYPVFKEILGCKSISKNITEKDLRKYPYLIKQYDIKKISEKFAKLYKK